MSLGVDAAILDRFEQSLHRCTADETFLQRFYARFLLSNEEVAKRFEGVDLKRQTRVLKTSLYLVLRAASGLADGMSHLEGIAHSHAKNGYDIKPSFYEHWLESLLLAAQETDPHFDDEIREAWVSSLRPCIDRMIERWTQD